MAAHSRTNTQLCDAYRARLMAEAAVDFGTQDLRGHVAFACGREDGIVDRKILAALLQHAPRLQDPARHADILTQHVTPADRGTLHRPVMVEEAFGFTGVRMMERSNDEHPRGRTPLYGPVKAGGDLFLVAAHMDIASMASKAGETNTIPEVILGLLFDEWEKGGGLAMKARAFIQELAMGVVSLMEHEANSRFERGVAFRDDFNVSALVFADRVVVIDGDTATAYQELGAFRREKFVLAERIGKSYTTKEEWKKHLSAIRGDFASGKSSQAVNYGADDQDALDELGLLGCFDILFRKIETTFIVPRSCVAGPLPQGGETFKIGFKIV